MSEEVKAQVGIKELMELLEGLQLLAVAGKKIGEDGKVNVADLGEVMKLVNNVGVLVAAVQGVGDIKAEVKDLDAAELQALGLKFIDLVNAVRAA